MSKKIKQPKEEILSDDEIEFKTVPKLKVINPKEIINSIEPIKKTKDRKPYILTDKRKDQFDKAREIRKQNVLLKKQEKENINFEYNKIKQELEKKKELKYKNKQKKEIAKLAQEAETESDESEESEEEIIIKKKPTPKKKYVKKYVSDDEEDEEEYIKETPKYNYPPPKQMYRQYL